MIEQSAIVEVPSLVEQPSLVEPDIPRDVAPFNDVLPATPLGDQYLQHESFMPPPSVLAPPTPQMHSMMSPSHSIMNYSMPMTPGVPMTPGAAMTPSVGNIPMTPGNLLHGDLTAPLSIPTPTMPNDDEEHQHVEMPGPPTFEHDLEHDLQHEGILPVEGLDHGGMTPHHTIENMESIPNLHADQISSILNEATTGMDKNEEQYTNMGFEGHPASPRANIQNDWNDDYDFPQSVGHVSLLLLLSLIFFLYLGFVIYFILSNLVRSNRKMKLMNNLKSVF